MALKEYQQKLRNEYRELYARTIRYLIEALDSGTAVKNMDLYLKPFERFILSKKVAIAEMIETEMLAAKRAALGKDLAAPIVDSQLKVTIQKSPFEAIIRDKIKILDRQFMGQLKDMKSDLKRIGKYNTLLSQPFRPEAGDAFTFARRTLDEIRNIGVENIERRLATGARFDRAQKQILKDLKKLATDGKIISEIRAPKKGIDMLSKVDEPDNFYFKLRQKSGKMAWYNGEKYAELVSRTTLTEAQYSAVVEKAFLTDRPLVVFSYTGKDYRSVKDPCMYIDGMIFSTIRNYKASNNKIYPYLYDYIKTPYLVPHPNCRHRLGNILDNPRTLAQYEQRSAANKYGAKPKAA